MEGLRGAILTVCMGGLVMVWALQQATRKIPYTPPSMISTLSLPETQLQDVGGVILGMRRLAADLAWIQTLQYYGTEEPGQTEFEFHNGMGQYPRFLAMVQRATHLDPSFTYIYLYGGAVLGWNLNRLDEAQALLKEGIANNPTEWRLPQYLAALAYQKNHDVTRLTAFLETIVQDPECPLMMKALLANIYKKQGDYDKALQLWETIYNAGDPDYQKRAIEQTTEIMKRLKRRS
jgi:tetratricopeptide (TPR) repeat protein